MESGQIRSSFASGATCPNCNQPVDVQDRHCTHCGVDLALAAVLAENALIVSNLPRGTPVAPEVLVPRLGEYLISKGVLNPADLEQALTYQGEHLKKGRTLLVGQALIELGLLEKEKLDQVITEQILELQAALRQANRRLEQRVRDRTSELQHALNKLAELNQLKSNFISNISHELRTPLTHIKGYLELMVDDGLGPLSLDQSQALQVMGKASGRLENLINDLLRFSMASRGEFTLHLSAISMADLAEAAIHRNASEAEARQIKLGLQLAPDLLPVRGDSEKLTWVLVQLLENGIKFTNPGGEVRLSARPTEMGVTVTVRDTGIGIPPERLDEVFEPFHQLDGSATRRHEGAGLGLALVRRIIEAHGALIRVDSTVGEGTRFEFTLPAASGDPFA
jgi:signal transduction histidine kinase